MEIIQAGPEDYRRIRLFYHTLIDDMQSVEYHPGWRKDVYPDPDELKRKITDGCLYYGVEQGEASPEIVSSMVIDHSFQDDAYAKAEWCIEASAEEILVIHMLGVSVKYAGRGLGRQMVRFAIEEAGKTGMKAVRLDVLEGNIPAEQLYLSMGFSYRNTVTMFYPDVGWMDFKLYEYALAQRMDT